MALTLENTLTEQIKRDRNLSDEEAKQEAKKEIVTRYLNVVPFGNGAYGIEAAAQTYFNKPAKDLTVPESAMLAGMVQSSSALDPYTNPEGVLERRNIVLDTMIANFPNRADEYRAAKRHPLGVAPRPAARCRTAASRPADAGFFCDYALQFLADERHDPGRDRPWRLHHPHHARPGGPDGIDDVGVEQITDPDLDGVANVMNVIRPGTESHDIMAMASSRVYGLDQKA